MGGSRAQGAHLHAERLQFGVRYKRLEKGTFKTPWRAEQGRVVIEAAELLLVLEGIDLSGSVRRARWSPQARPDRERFIARDSLSG